MKTKVILAFILLCAASKMFSQEFQGIAVYKSKRTLDIKIDSTKVNDEMINQMREQLAKEMQKDYTLKFSQKESVYTENEKLEAPGAKKGGMSIVISGSSSILYKNTAQQTYRRQQDLMGKLFLIQDSLEMPKWKLENETKMIGKYTCYKATLTKEVTERELRSNETEVREVIKDRIITVWYTPEIPVNNGPAEYWGLPGLILEVQEEKFSLLCSEIILNPSEKFEIEMPKKGKVVSQEEFEKVQTEKNREMIERYSRDQKDGKVFTIRSSGK